MAKKLPMFMYDSDPKLYNNFYESLDRGSYFKNPISVTRYTYYYNILKFGSKLYRFRHFNCSNASDLKLSNKSINKTKTSLG